MVENRRKVGGHEAKTEFDLLYRPSRLMFWGCFDHLDGFPDDAGTEVTAC